MILSRRRIGDATVKSARGLAQSGTLARVIVRQSDSLTLVFAVVDFRREFDSLCI
jgi:hypothetical protein